MKIKAKMKGDTVEVKMLAKHPMESGLRKDAEGKNIPAHFIEELQATYQGKSVFMANLGPAVSKNPYLKFAFSGGKKGQDIVLSWRDNQGKKVDATATIK